MTNLSQWAPLATAAAALVAAGVSLVLGLNRRQRLKMAIELADKIPREQQDEWNLMIYRDAQRILDRARLPLWIWILYFTGVACMGASGFVPEDLVEWALGVGLTLCVTATFAAGWAQRAVDRDTKTRVSRVNDLLVQEKARKRQREEEIRELEAYMRAQSAHAVWTLRAWGASRNEASEAAGMGADGFSRGNPAEWSSLIEQRRHSIAWRVRRARFRDPAPDLPEPRPGLLNPGSGAEELAASSSGS